MRERVMAMNPRSTSESRSRSAQAVDPLSWFTAPFAPLTFGAIILVMCTLLVVRDHNGAAATAVQLVAVVVCSSASLLVHVATRPRRPPVGWAVSSISLVVSLCGCLLSAVNYGADVRSFEQWWAPAALAMTITSLAPYLSVKRLVTLGLAATAVVGALGGIVFPAGFGIWSMPAVVLIVMTPPLLGVAASAFFSFTVVRTMQHLLVSRDEDGDGGEGANDAVRLAERNALARLTARVTPFLEELADAGEVTATDRTIAGQLARRLRDDLVSHEDASWLDGLAAGHHLVVMDPEKRADAMNAAQKSALTGLITAIFEMPNTASTAVLVELRGRENGATAVGVSMDLALAEGRRTMHLAPYYLTLKTAFEELSWSEGRLMNMRFEVPAKNSSGDSAL
jgi:hypothetical protein